MEFIEQDPRDCVYALFLGDDAATFDPDKLTVISRGRIETDNLNLVVEAAIIGESHYAIVRRGDGTVIAAELLACVDLDALGFRATERRSFRTEAHHGITLNHGEPSVYVRLGFTTSVLATRDDGVIVTQVGTDTLALRKSFPGLHAPETRVRCSVNSEARNVTIETVHEYAHGDRVESIFSETVIIL